MAALATGTATGPAKLKLVTELVDKLSDDLEKVSLLPKDRNQALEDLKVYGRDPRNADPIFTSEGISMLLRHAFHSPSSETARAALRVLANSMLLKPETRQMFVDHGFAPKACEQLKSESWDDEFLISRILFLSTYGTSVDLLNLIDKHALADNVVDKLSRHAKLVAGKSKEKVEPMEAMALPETLKLLFNVTHFCHDRVPNFSPAIPHIVILLWKQEVPSTNPLDPPFGPLVNALLNLDGESEKFQTSLYPKDEPTKVTSKLIELLDKALKHYGDNDLESVVTPLVSLIAKVYKHAPEAVQEHLRQSLLPTAEDRKAVLGKGQSLSARLLKNSTNPVAPALRDAISHLLFDMSDRDASKFVENVGYGFASGFLFQNNVAIPASASEAYSTSDGTGGEKPVNPITGQFLDNEKHPEEKELTQEEKEREAERLFVLFERLKKNGIINVENPVATAVREGRFRELDDDEVEELD
ncbi:Synembryn-like protein C3E7.04c [Paramyrothecium foliicola]|nr:Synembryn-like protein C3E7.04c [Paramyrothecium foliicola]